MERIAEFLCLTKSIGHDLECGNSVVMLVNVSFSLKTIGMEA